MEVKNIEVEPAPRGFEEYHQTLLTPDALKFVAQLVATHDQEVDYVCISPENLIIGVKNLIY